MLRYLQLHHPIPSRRRLVERLGPAVLLSEDLEIAPDPS
jgi:hypothetical protein